MRKAIAVLVVGSAFGSIFACGNGGTEESGFAAGGTTSDGGRPDTGTACTGDKLACTCTNLPAFLDGGKPEGFQCKTEAGYGPCVCVAPAARCGDGICQNLEDCSICKVDCGECPKCPEAPACDRAKTPPLAFTALPEFNLRFQPTDLTRDGLSEIRALKAEGSPAFRAVVQVLLSPPTPGEAPFFSELRGILSAEPRLFGAMQTALRGAGIANAASYLAGYAPVRILPRQAADASGVPCGAPKLRVRLQRIKVLSPENKPFIGSDGDKIYCILTSESNVGSEIRITPVTPRLNSGQDYAYSLYKGVFWGQDVAPTSSTSDGGAGTITYEVPRPPRGDLMLSYRCWSQHNDTTWTSILTAAGNASAQVAGVAGAYGWVFGTAAVISQVAAAAVAAAQQDTATVYNAQQIITEDKQIGLTYGASWSVTGGKNGANYEMTMQAWGCAENGGGRRDAGTTP